MTLRARLGVVLAAAVTALAGGGGALACANVHLGATTPAVGPGGTVRFTITNLVAGANWTVSLEGGGTKSGIAAQDGAVSGELTMPDLGSTSRTLTLSGVVVHDDIDGSPWPVSAPGGVTYEAPAAAAPPQPVPEPAPPAPVAPPQDQPAETVPTQPAQPAPVAVAPVATPAPSVAPVRTTRPSREPVARPVAARPRAARAAAAQPARGHTTTKTVRAAPPVARLARAPAATAPAEGRTVARRTRARPHPVHEPAVHHPIRAQQPHASGRPHAPSPVETRSPAPSKIGHTGPQLGLLDRLPAVPASRHAGVPWTLLVAGVLVLLVAACSGGATILIRRRPRPPAPDEIEAELQELLAEERMKQLQSHQQLQSRQNF